MRSKKGSEAMDSSSAHPDHSHEITRLRKIVGQLQGVEKMILARRYCPQILQQITSASSALNALKIEIMKTHLNECLTESARSGNYTRLLEQVLEIVQAKAR